MTHDPKPYPYEKHNELWREWYDMWHAVGASKPKLSYEEWLEDKIESLERDLDVAIVAIRRKGSRKVVSDGFGSIWDLRCPNCGEDSIQVVRPGKVQCAICD